MKQAQTNFLNMASATETLLMEQKPLWTGSKPITRVVDSLAADLVAVKAAQKAKTVVTTGVTDDKESAGDAAITLAVKLAGFAVVYALDEENQSLAQQLDVSFSALDKLPDALLAPTLRKLHETISSIGPVVEDYGITPAKLAELDAAITKFEKINSAPRVLVSERKATSQGIPLLIRSIRLSLLKLDKLLPLFADTHPQFYNSYKNARIIIDLGGRGSGGDTPADGK